MADETKNRKPSQAGQYYLTEKIAQGGMAEIYKGLAYDANGLKRTVCIKKILPHISSNPEFIESLIDEAKIAVTLSHGNIAQTYDLGKVEDDYFIVMEHINGKSLSQVAKKASREKKLVPLPLVCHFISEVANGLDYIHRRTDSEGHPLHIVHRDMSPQNVIISYSGTVKIIDFGIAIAANRLGLTEVGILKGKFAYMSPEQAKGESLDHRSDIFSLGVMLFELITGKRLFKAEDNRETIRNVRKANVPLVCSLRPELPEAFETICQKALAKDRRKRYRAASEFRDDLLKLLHTHYPEFRQSDASSFMQTLFAEELKQNMEKQEATPHLIIDSTQSALAEEKTEHTGAGKIPENMRDFFLEDFVEEKSDDENENKISPSENEEPADETPDSFPHEEKTEKHKSEKKSYKTLFSLLIAGITLLLIFSTWYLTKTSQQITTVVKDAQLMLSFEPGEAQVLFDGKEVGTLSPLSLDSISPQNTHELSISKEGYEPYEKELLFANGETRTLHILLKEIPPALASLQISSQPSGAKIFLNEQETPYKTPTTLSELKPGPYTIGLYLENYKFWKRKIVLKENDKTNYDIELGLDFGSAVITSQPSDALVFLNGKPSGQTPLKLEHLEPGKIYQVEIWHEGYEHARQEIKIKPGRDEQVRVTLQKEIEKGTQ